MYRSLLRPNHHFDLRPTNTMLGYGSQEVACYALADMSNCSKVGPAIIVRIDDFPRVRRLILCNADLTAYAMES